MSILSTVGTALSALLSGGTVNNTATLTAERFIADFGARAADRVAELDKDPTARGNEKLATLAAELGQWALAAGWDVSKTFVDTAAQSIVAAVTGRATATPPPSSQPSAQKAAA